MCVLRTLNNVLTFCHNGKIVMLISQNAYFLRHLGKIQFGIAVIDFTMKLGMKKHPKIPVNISFIKWEIQNWR